MPERSKFTSYVWRRWLSHVGSFHSRTYFHSPRLWCGFGTAAPAMFTRVPEIGSGIGRSVRPCCWRRGLRELTSIRPVRKIPVCIPVMLSTPAYLSSC